MTTRLTLNSPLMLGFEHIERTLDRFSKSTGDGYPPYNIEQVGETKLRITLAVAGFTTDMLSLQVEGNQLVIHGRQKDDEERRVFLHRGIAARQFQKSFLLAEGIEVKSASLDNGLLNVDLSRPLPQINVRKVEIKQPMKAGTSNEVPVSVET